MPDISNYSDFIVDMLSKDKKTVHTFETMLYYSPDSEILFQWFIEWSLDYCSGCGTENMWCSCTFDWSVLDSLEDRGGLANHFQNMMNEQLDIKNYTLATVVEIIIKGLLNGDSKEDITNDFLSWYYNQPTKIFLEELQLNNLKGMIRKIRN